MAIQIEVYLTPLDEERLITRLKDQFGLIMLRVLCFDESERVVHSLGDLGMYPTDLQIALAEPDVLSECRIDSYSEGHRRLHTTDSPVIEFKRSSLLASDRLKPGRFAYFVDDESGSPKSEKFRKFARAVFRELRATLHPLTKPLKSLCGEQVTASLANDTLKLLLW